MSHIMEAWGEERENIIGVLEHTATGKGRHKKREKLY